MPAQVVGAGCRPRLGHSLLERVEDADVADRGERNRVAHPPRCLGQGLERLVLGGAPDVRAEADPGSSSARAVGFARGEPGGGVPPVVGDLLEARPARAGQSGRLRWRRPGRSRQPDDAEVLDRVQDPSRWSARGPRLGRSPHAPTAGRAGGPGRAPSAAGSRGRTCARCEWGQHAVEQCLLLGANHPEEHRCGRRSPGAGRPAGREEEGPVRVVAASAIPDQPEDHENECCRGSGPGRGDQVVARPPALST